MANVDGRATALTVLNPVWPGARFVLAIVFWVGRAFPSTLKKLSMLSFIHYARWTTIPNFPHSGGRERLHHAYLLFESNFDGTWDEYIDAFSEVVPWRMRAVWFTSYGFPGPLPVEPFKQYIRKNEYVANHFWSAYPDAATTEVLSAGTVAAAVDELAGRSSGMDPAQFKGEFDRMLTQVQHDL